MNTIQLIIYKILIKLYAFVALIFKLPNPVVARKILISKEIYEKQGGRVACGFFKDMVIPNNISWGVADQAAMLLGLYEKEVQDILFLAPSHCTRLIDLGAADGYYAVGTTLKGKFEEAICYEIDSGRRKIIKENALSNGVNDKIVIHGAAEKNFLDNFNDEDLSKYFLLIDIEGAEFDILNIDNLKKLKEAHVLVEIHDHRIDDGHLAYEKLINNSNKFFNVQKIYNGARNPFENPLLKDFSHDDGWLIASEGRKRNGHWLYLTPK